MGAQDFPRDPSLDATMDTGWMVNAEAEQSVIGALLLDNSAMDRIADLLHPSQFFRRDHRIIAKHLLQMISDNMPADPLTLAESLRRTNELSEVGGEVYLGQLMLNTPTAVNVRRYAEIVAERSMSRQLFGAASGIAESVRYPAGKSVRELVDLAQAKMMSINAEQIAGRAGFVDTTTMMSETMQEVDAAYIRYQNGTGSDVTGLATGFVDLDRATTGLHPGQLVILAARPSMGKSALALNMMEGAAQSSGKPAVMFSLEMSTRELGVRLLGSVASINVQRLFTGRLKESEWPKMVEAVGRINELPILINESPGMTIGEMRAMARRIKREKQGLGLIVVDYLQLMVGGDTDQNRATQMAEITRGLKLLAKELKVPVIALSQLNRELEKRTNKRPIMSDLRESGSIEQDADMILFIYRDEVYNAQSEHQGIAELIIAKQRNGPTTTIRLVFRKDATRFDNYAGY